MSSTDRNELWSGLGTALVVIAIGAFIMWSDANKRDTITSKIESLPPRERNLAVFDAATNLLETHYYDSQFFASGQWRDLASKWRNRAADVSPPMLYENVLDGLSREFPDSHLAFVSLGRNSSPEVIYERVRSAPGFRAVEIRRGRERPQVVDDVLRDSPAERAGITPGWMMLKDEFDVTPDHARFSGEFLELDADASRQLETLGKLQVEDVTSYYETEVDPQSRSAHTVKVEFELERILPQEDFETRELPGGVTYLRFDVFEEMAVVEKALDTIDAAGPAGLIIDLRRNPGGRLVHLQRVGGGLLGDNSLLGIQRVANSSKPMKSWRFTNPYEGPLVLLIGPTTASAAEIIAAAVQDQKRGKLIGRRTNGSVVPAEWFALPDGGRMMIPMTDFVRSDGKRIEGHGVEPDIWVLPTLDDVRTGRDPALERALRELRSGTT